MIAVTVYPSGDRAEAATPEDAVFAAITMIDEAKPTASLQGVRFTATFRGPDGAVIRAAVPERLLWATAGSAA